MKLYSTLAFVFWLLSLFFWFWILQKRERKNALTEKGNNHEWTVDLDTEKQGTHVLRSPIAAIARSAIDRRTYLVFEVR